MNYIGCFQSNQEQLSICDPIVSNVARRKHLVDIVNVCSLLITAHKGVWNTYHLLNEEGMPDKLILIWDGLSLKFTPVQINRLDDLPFTFHLRGLVCTSFGRAICTVSPEYYDHSEYAYFGTSDNNSYLLRTLVDWIKSSTSEEEKAKLQEVIKPYIENNEEYINCSLIDPIINYRYVDCHSDLWSTDCHERLFNSYMCGTTIKGGCISRSYTDFNSCYTDDNSIASIIVIELNGNTNRPLPMLNEQRNTVSHTKGPITVIK